MADIYPADALCECGHRYADHKPGGGPCWKLGSLKCDCWEFEPVPAGGPDDDPPLREAA